MPAEDPTSPSVLPVSNDVAGELAQRAARRDFIDLRIAELEEEIRKWKSDRNELSDIARLPPEVLSRVFIHYQQLCASLSRISDFGRILRPFEWTQVTHVSRYWRDTALAFPELWSNIQATTNPRWAQVMFDRAKQAPISLTFSSNSSTRPELAEVIKDACSQHHRLKGLNVIGYNDFIRQMLEKLTSPAPNLQTLNLEYGGLPYVDLGRPSIPNNLLGGEAPSLRQLHLSGYQFSWATLLPISSRLTSFKLNSMPRKADGFPGPDVDVFFQGMEAMRNLQELELNIKLPITPLSTFRVIPLPKLESLKLTGCFRECENVMRHLALPSSLRATFEVTHDVQDTDVNASTFGQTLSSSWLSGPLSDPPCVIRDLVVDNNHYRARITGRLSGVYSPSVLNLTLNSNKFLSEVLAALPLNGVTNLGLMTGFTAKDLGTLSRLPSVRTVQTDRFASEEFFAYARRDPALNLVPTKPNKGGTSKNKAKRKPKTSPPKLTRFASVKRLVFECADFESIDIEHFLDWLMMRYELGREIESVKLYGCVRLYEDDVQRIEEVVVDVDWDGDEIEYYSDEEEEEDEDHGCGLPGCINCYGDDSDFADYLQYF
ncbi:hypothetical protein CC1G_07910 [Coprinopsis cinerea okayama7|uniref:Uncharacterized protein n=1 Tax=Coprinopsis cinerea (strain Okayama-7 / 130 / ATCC MYA-4618 / FGSC 9003) TaxID=240176 RepID=A8P6N9_COPC7|nr:hypothetical protein CC1G_07910 [Coprinopsis cinerea okayama7\|eukprot:XP_001839195.1 hypothetical protein CC1G_07910 [Coprinopsis cinerea okayama7\